MDEAGTLSAIVLSLISDNNERKGRLVILLTFDVLYNL
jgi:hypothetical protein